MLSLNARKRPKRKERNINSFKQAEWGKKDQNSHKWIKNDPNGQDYRKATVNNPDGIKGCI